MGQYPGMGSLSGQLAIAGLWLSLAVVGLARNAQAADSPRTEPSVFRVYVGTYTSGTGAEKSQGIYLMDLDLASGKLGAPRLAAEAVDPSFLAIHPGGKFLYAVSERGEVNGKPGGAVLGFSIDPESGDLKAINSESTRGADPCHLIVDKAGRNVLVANYTGGSVACLPIDDAGRLSPCSAFIQHQGTGADPGRQKGPHAHSINLDAAGRFAVAADLGLDKVFVYRFDPAKGSLIPNDPPFGKVAPGSGPRHFAFHPGGRSGYVINEMANTITAFAYDAEKGALDEIQTISTLPAGFGGKSHTAEVQVHPSGKFVFGSNRGHDSIAVFAVSPETSKLSLLEIEPTAGQKSAQFCRRSDGSVSACRKW